MSAPLLEARQLRCEREERLLFSALDMSLEAGELLRIEGPNGAGKTTLMRTLAGLERRIEGEVFWRGMSLHDHREMFHADTLVLGHAPGIKLALTARENLQWIVAVRTGSAPTPQAVNAALDAVGLADEADRPCQYLSAGQKRRVALARLFLEPASLWILDEPFSAIDRDGVAALEQLMALHVQRGGAALVVTHHAWQVDPPLTLRRLMLGTDRRGGWRLS